MAGKISLITGARGGLGTHVTKAFLDAGFTVIGLSPKIKQSDFTHANFTALPASLDTRQAARQAVDEVMKKFGRIDILIHTVGGFSGGQPLHETDDATFQRMFDINVNAALHILRAVIPHMRQASYGRIIGIGSRAGEIPAATIGAYSVSKAAFESLMRTVALENKDFGITANTILPSTIDTRANRHAMPNADTSQWVKPEIIASLTVWLARDAGTDVNGAAIPVYGAAL